MSGYGSVADRNAGTFEGSEHSITAGSGMLGVYPSFFSGRLYELMVFVEQVYSEQEQRSRRLAMHLEADDYSDDDEPITQVQSTEQPITLNEDVQFERQVLLAVLAPIGHTYLTVAETLTTLLGNVVPENDFIKECVTSIKVKVDSNRCQFGKCVRLNNIII